MNVDVTTVHRAQGSERKIVLFDPVDGASQLLRGVTGRRLINVAASRAMTHLHAAMTDVDRTNPAIAQLLSRAAHHPFEQLGPRVRFG
jgi:ATP-dependent exoDNAse (exonuclease V) alpha subunit